MAMQTEQITVNGKVGSIAIKGTYDYEYPTDLESGIENDGEDKVFKLYRNERKTTFMDKCRKDLIERATKKIADQMGTMEL